MRVATAAVAKLVAAITSVVLLGVLHPSMPYMRACAGKSRGYAFIEYEDKKDMKEAYKTADGRKIEGRRVLVDVERGRTVESWWVVCCSADGWHAWVDGWMDGWIWHVLGGTGDVTRGEGRGHTFLFLCSSSACG